MEYISGKTAGFLDAANFEARLKNYQKISLDIGTGDGRFVLQHAAANPQTLVIGLDACRENLRDSSRKAPVNALFVIGCAFNLPAELAGRVDNLTINFAWGSLLAGLLGLQPDLYDQLALVARPGAKLEVRLNSSALQQVGYSLEEGARYIRANLLRAGFNLNEFKVLTSTDLRQCPSTWAKKLAFGGLATPGHLITASC